MITFTKTPTSTSTSTSSARKETWVNQIMVKQSLSEFFGPRRLYFVCGKVYQDMSYANRIVHWFVQHKLPVVPITPTGGNVDLSIDSITRRATDQKFLEIYKSIPEALKCTSYRPVDDISVCFVTPPLVTLSILKELKANNMPLCSVWFQPGSWNMDCVNYAEHDLNIKASNVINDCILVNGHTNYKPSELIVSLSPSL